MAVSVDQAATLNSSMGTVLNEITSDTVDAKHVERRIVDWIERVNRLYAMIGDWLPDGWEARRGAPIVMHEQLMREFGIPAKRIPTLELFALSGDTARLEPRALWIVGINGRVDLKRDGCRYHIVDMAKYFERPEWQAARAERRRDGETITREWLRLVLQ